MENLLKFSVNHLSTIEAFKFDLSEDEVMKMAQISR